MRQNSPSPYPGFFLIFEGLDGSGQSTQAQLLENRLQKEGRQVLLTKEPTNSLIGGLIRGALTSEWSPDPPTLQLLLAADRGHHLHRQILPALQQGRIVISDRYYLSALAYGSLNLERDWLRKINAHFLEPDCGFYLKVDPHTCLQRILDNRFELELFEKESELRRVARAYEEIVADCPYMLTIDGEGSVAEIHERIYVALQACWKKGGSR
jgi:dTMP kinase